MDVATSADSVSNEALQASTMDSVASHSDLDMGAADPAALSYDDTTSYEAQVSALAEASSSSLANRIGTTRVYLFEESTGPRAKRKLADEQEMVDDDAEMAQEDPTRRPNALLLHGPPISLMPTARLFAYTTHFDAKPLALEWVDDTTCVLVFSSRSAARTALSLLSKPSSMQAEPDEQGFVSVKPVPMSLWPPEARIDASLAKSSTSDADSNETGTRPANAATTMKEPMGIRWARIDDVKKKAARQESEFYRKHGDQAGKEVYNPRTGRVEPPEITGSASKRRRRGSDDWEGDEDRSALRARLDDELDDFLREDDGATATTNGHVEKDREEEPRSRMRSDYIQGTGTLQVGEDGRTLMERTSVIRAHPPPEMDELPLLSRLADSGPASDLRRPSRSNRGGGGTMSRESRSGKSKHRSGENGSANGSGARPKKSQQELDDELEAFLRER